MNIYIDESGSFVNASSFGKWNAVAALAVPEIARRRLDTLVKRIALVGGGSGRLEVKLNGLAETDYFEFLIEVEKLGVILFCTATDAGRNTSQQVTFHQKQQIRGILEHIDKMKYESGRQGVMIMADHIRQLPPQLYVQLMCQIDLMYDVVSRSINYFAQRNAATLREFRWRVDQKNSNKPTFEKAFERLSPALLQSRSIEEPMMMIKGFDYSFMTQYEYPNSRPPDYLEELYGIKVESGFDIQKLIRGNMQFVDSKQCLGVQAVDLLVSGVRRCLRGEFIDNALAAKQLGKLMLQAANNKPSLNLLTFGISEALPTETAQVINIMSKNSRRMLAS